MFKVKFSVINLLLRWSKIKIKKKYINFFCYKILKIYPAKVKNVFLDLWNNFVKSKYIIMLWRSFYQINSFHLLLSYLLFIFFFFLMTYFVSIALHYCILKITSFVHLLKIFALFTCAKQRKCLFFFPHTKYFIHCLYKFNSI